MARHVKFSKPARAIFLVAYRRISIASTKIASNLNKMYTDIRLCIHVSDCYGLGFVTPRVLYIAMTLCLSILGACTSEGYSSWVCVPVYVCLHMQAGYSVYRDKYFNLWISLKVHKSKVTTINTFHGDPTYIGHASLCRWGAPANIDLT